MERTTIITTDVGYVIDEVTACVMELIEKDRQAEAQRRKAEIEPLYYTLKESAEKLHISVTSLHNRIKQGHIPAYRIGRRTLIKAIDIDKSLIKKIS